MNKRMVCGALLVGFFRPDRQNTLCYDYEEFINRDKACLDIFWLRDESLEESDNLPDPDVLAQEIVEDLEAALEQFREIAVDLGSEEVKAEKS